MNDVQKSGNKWLKGCLITAGVLLGMGILTIGGCVLLFSKAASTVAEEQSQIRILNIVKCNRQLIFYEFENAGKKTITAFQGRLLHVDDFGKQDTQISHSRPKISSHGSAKPRRDMGYLNFHRCRYRYRNRNRMDLHGLRLQA